MKQVLPLDILVLDLNPRRNMDQKTRVTLKRLYTVGWDGRIARAVAVVTMGEETVAHWWVSREGGSSCCLGWHVLALCYQVSLGSCLYSKPDSSGSLSLVYEMIPLSLWNIPLYFLNCFLLWIQNQDNATSEVAFSILKVYYNLILLLFNPVWQFPPFN